jgi:hypothetical protein
MHTYLHIFILTHVNIHVNICTWTYVSMSMHTLLGVTLLQCCMREAGSGSFQYKVPNIGSLEGLIRSLGLENPLESFFSIYAYIYLYMYICIYIYIYIYIFIYIYIYRQYIYIYIHIYRLFGGFNRFFSLRWPLGVFFGRFGRLWIYIYTYIFKYIYMYIYIYMYTYMYTYILIYV